MVVGPEPYSITALALIYRIGSRSANQYKKYEEFSYTIEMAKTKIEADYERRLLEERNIRGVIFALKNNFGWKDRAESQVKTKKIMVYKPTETTIVKANDKTNKNPIKVTGKETNPSSDADHNNGRVGSSMLGPYHHLEAGLTSCLGKSIQKRQSANALWDGIGDVVDQTARV